MSKAGSFSVERTVLWGVDNKENQPMAKQSPLGEGLQRVGNGPGERKHVGGGASRPWVLAERGDF